MTVKKQYPVLHLDRVDFAIPSVGFGTYEASAETLNSGAVKRAVLEALKAGYRHIDTASYYMCEKDVGEAIKESGIPREEIFVTTKFWNQYHAAEDVEKSLDESLERLGLEYVDLYLMHWPIAFKHDENMNILYHEDGKTPILDEEQTKNHIYTYEAMENCVRTNKALHIGVSNCSIKRLGEILSFAEIPPVVNQVEAHPYFPQKELLEYCKNHNILLQAYSPLGSQHAYEATNSKYVLEDEIVGAIAKKYNVEPAQVLIAWAVQRGTCPLPKSATPERIQRNIQFLELSKGDFEAVDTLTEKDPSKLQRMVDFDKTWGVKSIGISSIWDY